MQLLFVRINLVEILNTIINTTQPDNGASNMTTRQFSRRSFDFDLDVPNSLIFGV